MILRPATTRAMDEGVSSAWQAIAETQTEKAAKYYLVRQPDHARLAGEIAQKFDIPGAPCLDGDIVQGISLHDEGWSAFDDGRERLSATCASYSDDNFAFGADGKPVSFLDTKAADFLRAWRGSIEAAEAVAPVAGLIVSAHFRRIGEFGMSQARYSSEDLQQVRDFVALEQERQRRLLDQQDRGPREIEFWTDVLQFCDLLSLYLCCGAQVTVEFPQHIVSASQVIRVKVHNGVYGLSPSPFARNVDFSAAAWSYPSEGAQTAATLRWNLR